MSSQVKIDKKLRIPTTKLYKTNLKPPASPVINQKQFPVEIHTPVCPNTVRTGKGAN